MEAAIVGGVFGGVLTVIVLGLLFWYRRQRRGKRRKRQR